MTTPVLFRFFDGEVTAVFPTQPGTNDPWTMGCYAHIGQHGSCSYEWYRKTRPANPEEFAELHKELIRVGYDDLVIVKRISGKMDQERIDALKI